MFDKKIPRKLTEEARLLPFCCVSLVQDRNIYNSNYPIFKTAKMAQNVKHLSQNSKFHEILE
ncbi:MAG: hypothetical protein QNJ51_27335 [Calothrix sp. MO_167.B12]|nr:hypothetical protein [Calothrix sp. MO_167.B12]